MATEILRPISTVFNGWGPVIEFVGGGPAGCSSVGGFLGSQDIYGVVNGATVHEVLDEPSPDDSDFIHTAGGATNACIVKLGPSPVDAVDQAGTFRFRVRARYTARGGVVDTFETVSCQLVEEVVPATKYTIRLRGDLDGEAGQGDCFGQTLLTESWQQFEMQLPMSSILVADWSKAFVTLRASPAFDVGGVSINRVDISWVEIVVPTTIFAAVSDPSAFSGTFPADSVAVSCPGVPDPAPVACTEVLQ